ncbi:MAG: hypothetical protein H7Y16_08765 [Candidatus Parcubacteria bacterium]|nr:hypothetical protein [Burkholderiales bacterium]
MRFSAVFQLPRSLPRAAQEGESARIEASAGVPAPALPAAEPSRWPLDLPEDLDARVRLVGEWQFGEG